MEIIVAKTAGFCFGVKEAVKTAYEHEGEDICCLGNLIHNEIVTADLKEKGISTKSLEEIILNPPKKVIIRSHGVGKEIIEKLEKAGCEIVDATCPFVKKIHDYVAKYSKEGYHILITGEKDHDEVVGIVGWIENDNYSVINSRKEAEKFSLNKTIPICIVSQTTFNKNLFKDLVEIINQKGYDVCALSTICDATRNRQREAEEIAGKVDAMIVIGSRTSSNSKRLYEVTKGKCKTYFLQRSEDFDPTVLHSIETVGITAGASTPDKIIREVISECQK